MDEWKEGEGEWNSEDSNNSEDLEDIEEEFPIGCPVYGLKREGPLLKYTSFDVCPISKDGRCEKTYKCETPSWFRCGLKSDRAYKKLLEYFEGTMVEFEEKFNEEGRMTGVKRVHFRDWWSDMLKHYNSMMRKWPFLDTDEDDF